MTDIGIIGGGAFGALLARMLLSLPESRQESIRIYEADPGVRRELAAAGMTTVAHMAGLAGCQTLMLAVPWPVFGAVLQDLTPLLRPGMTVIDVCSVKLAPM